VLDELNKALPNDSSIILITRNYRVAFGLEDGDGPSEKTMGERCCRAIAEEGYRSAKKIAEKVARGLGYHPQAL
jgi:hypothetical protein